MKLNIQSIANGDSYLSTSLLDLISKEITVPKDDPYTFIMPLIMLMDNISKMGAVEHTSDWDLGATIITRDDKTIEVPNGYGDCLTIHNDKGEDITDMFNWYPKEESKHFTLRLTDSWPNDEDLEPFSVKLSDIKTIFFYS